MIIQNTLWRTYLSNKSLPGAHTDTNRFLAMKVTTQQEDYLISHMKCLPWIFFLLLI